MAYFTRNEKKDLLISIAVITLLFALINSGYDMGTFIILIPLSLISIGLGFILHELGHKIIAQRYGFYAEYKKWTYGLIIAIITGLLGFVFLAPGAVYIGSYTGTITEEENGKISIAGPIVNIILAVIFLGIGISIQPFIDYNNILILYLRLTSMIGFSVNSFLALFNLLPIPPLDGSKVIKWNIPLWITTIVLSGILTYASYTINLI